MKIFFEFRWLAIFIIIGLAYLKLMNLYIVGAGGHGKVVADLSRLLNLYKKICFFDVIIT